MVITEYSLAMKNLAGEKCPDNKKARRYNWCSFGLSLKRWDQASDLVFNTLRPR
jgi:hypothetical protein